MPLILVRFLTAIAGSKKAVAAIATVLLILLKPQLAKIGVDVTEQELEYIVGVALAYLVGQGIADAGKGAAQVKAAAAPAPAEPS